MSVNNLNLPEKLQITDVTQLEEIIIPSGYQSVSQVIEVWYGKQPEPEKKLIMIDINSIIDKPILIKGFVERTGKFGSSFLVIYASAFTKKGEFEFVFSCGGSVVFKKLMMVKDKLPLVGIITLQIGDRGEYYDLK